MKSDIYINVGRYRLPVHMRKDAKSGQIRYRIRLTKDINSDGKRKDFDITDTSIEGLTIKVENLLYPYHYLMTPDHSSILFNDIAEMWFRDSSIAWVDSTRRRYRNHLDKNILPYTKGFRLVDINTQFLQRYFSNRIALEPGMYSLRESRTIFHSIFEYCIAGKYLMTNPCNYLKIPKPVFDPQEALSYEQQRTLMKAFQNHPEDECIVAALLYTGGRISEVLGLSWTDLNEASGILRIANVLSWKYENDKKTYYLRQYNKTRAVRNIVLTSTAIQYFQKQRKWQQEMKEFAGPLWNEPIKDLIFTDPFGKPIVYSSFNERFRKIVDSLGTDMNWIHIHTLRHTAATNYYHVTNDIVKTAEFLGHASIYTTLRYTHSTFEDKKEVAKALDRIHMNSSALS